MVTVSLISPVPEAVQEADPAAAHVHETFVSSAGKLSVRSEERRVGDEGSSRREPWQGKAWTATADSAPSMVSVINPTDFSGLTAGEPLCADGTVAADYGSVAMLGLNLNQDSAPASPANPDPGGHMSHLMGVFFADDRRRSSRYNL